MADVEKFTYYDSGRTKVIKPTDRMVIGSGGLAFEGSTSNDFETEITVTDPTADRTIEIPDEDGEIALLQGNSLPKALSFPVKNPSNTTALTKGQIVYISGHSGNKPEVSLAQSNSASTMPAFGFVQSDIAAEAEGFVVYSGLFKGIDTNTSYSEGDTLYVSSTSAGDFQNTAPAGDNLIQNIGKIIKSDSSNGELLVGGAGRTNATPNLNEGHFFVGDASNQSIESAYQVPLTLGTNGQVLASNGTNVTFQDASSGSLYTILDSDVSATSIVSESHYILPYDATADVSITLPDEDTTGAGDFFQKTFKVENRSDTYNVNMSSVGTLNNSYRYYNVNGTLISSGNLSDAVPPKTTRLFYVSSYSAGSYIYWRAYNDILAYPVENLGNVNVTSLTDKQILEYDDTTNKWVNIDNTGGITVETKTANFSASPGFFYIAETTSGQTMQATVPNSGYIKGDRIKIFNTGEGILKIIEADSPTTLDPIDTSGPLFGSSRTLNSKCLVELVATSTTDWKYVIIPQLELDSSSLSRDGEIFAYDSSEKAMKPLNYTLPSAVGVDDGKILTYDHANTEMVFSSLNDVVMAELSIPGLDLQTDTNAFRFNCPYDLTITGLNLFLDQHTTSGNVTVTVTNTTDSLSIASLTLGTTATTGSTTSITNAACDSGDIITFAITATPANAQGLRANLKFTRGA